MEYSIDDLVVIPKEVALAIADMFERSNKDKSAQAFRECKPLKPIIEDAFMSAREELIIHTEGEYSTSIEEYLTRKIDI